MKMFNFFNPAGSILNLLYIVGQVGSTAVCSPYSLHSAERGDHSKPQTAGIRHNDIMNISTMPYNIKLLTCNKTEIVKLYKNTEWCMLFWRLTRMTT